MSDDQENSIPDETIDLGPAPDLRTELLDSSDSGLLGDSPDQTQNFRASEVTVEPNAQPAPALPTTLGRFAVGQPLDLGDPWLVYAGRDSEKDQQVVIQATIQSVAPTRLEEEVSRLSQLEHAGLGKIFEAGVQEPWSFLVGEFVEGQSLDQWLSKHKPTWSQSLVIVAAVADALVHAHSHNIVHGRITLTNIILSERSEGVRPVLINFGLSNAQSQSTIGASPFLSPEQIRGMTMAIDHRTDVYSLGVVFYRLLSGALPFRTDEITELQRQIKEEAPQPLRQLDSLIPPELESICKKAMAKSMTDRFATTAEMCNELQLALNQYADDVATAGTIKLDQHKAETKSVGPATFMLLDSDLATAIESVAGLDEDSRNEVLSEFRKICDRVTERFEGTIVRATNRRMLVTFGASFTEDEIAGHAVSGGLEILDELSQLFQRRGVGITVSIDVRTGLADMQNESESSADTPILPSPSRRIATRLEGTARSSGSAVSHETFSFVERTFECERQYDSEPNEGDGPIVYEVTREDDVKTRLEIAPPVEFAPLAGRATQVAILRSRWEQAKEGLGQIVSIIGDAGFGKSRLVDEIKQHVIGENTDEQPRVIEWRCLPNSQHQSLRPAASYFANDMNLSASDSREARLEKLIGREDYDDLGRSQIVPALSSLLQIPTEDNLPSLDLTQMKQKEIMEVALLNWLRLTAKKQPVLFIVEDLQWADPTTLELLSSLVERGLSNRILTVLTFRPQFQTPWGSRSYQTQVALNRLTKRGVKELLCGCTGLNDIPPEIVATVVERTDAVPRFIEQIAIMAKRSQSIREVGGKVEWSDDVELGLE